jgi:NAD+-dependent protein deacetylase SIR2
MDVNGVGTRQSEVTTHERQVITLDSSDDEYDLQDALVTPRVNGVSAAVNGLKVELEPLDASDESDDEDGVEGEDENDDWEIDSLFEDTLEELGDENLFDGGE